MKKCLGCYESLRNDNKSSLYHHKCSKKLFGTEVPPTIDFGMKDLEKLAKKSILQNLGVTGVQPKITLHIDKKVNDPNHRMMIVGLWGNYILKPPTKNFSNISIVEDLTMHMAEAVGLKTAQHGLIQLASGELAYITKRFDRGVKEKKIAVEDFCQLSELLTESKYSTSTEKAGKIILKYSAQPGLDVITFFDLILFSYLSGNADMHLKNFSLVANDLNEMVFSPVYDLLSTKLMPIDDKEEVALTINGKKSKLNKNDFLALGKTLLISDRAVTNSFSRILSSIPNLKKVIAKSFLNSELKTNYKKLLDQREKVLS